jgi:hypothetical protein
MLVLDNCEHLLDACAALVVALQGHCAAGTVVAGLGSCLGTTMQNYPEHEGRSGLHLRKLTT